MAFPPSFLEELRNRLPLSEIVSRRLRLARAGREFKAPCPFHNEKTPSFYVNDQKGFFHCFGCGAHGDVIGFVMRHDNLSFPETVELLAGQAGLDVPKSTPEERERFERRKSQYDLVEAAARWFEERLARAEGREASAYLRKRGLDADIIARFRLGYAPSDGAALGRHLREAGFSDEDVISAGLLRKPEDGRSPYAFFRNRVMFPVTDRRGRVVAFGGRIIEGDGPKYINSPDTDLFQKGSLLYGMARARQAAADDQPLIVVEGYMDVISLVANGFSGAVAPLGTALTEQQIMALWKLSPGDNRAPVLCFDGDGAGRRAAWRAVERVLPHLAPDRTVRVAFLPQGEDPDSLVRTGGRRGMQDVLDAAQPLMEVLWDMEAATRRLDGPEARAGLKAALEARIETIADRDVRQFYGQELRRRLDAAFGWKRSGGGGGGWSAPGRMGGGRRGPVAGTGPRPKRVLLARPDLRERILLAAILNHPSLFDEFGDDVAMMQIGTTELDNLRQAVVQLLSRDSALDASLLYSHLCDHGFAGALEDVLDRSIYRSAPFAAPGTSLEKVRSGWRDIRERTQRRGVWAELREAELALARETSEANFAKLNALRGEVALARGAELGDPDQDD